MSAVTEAPPAAPEVEDDNTGDHHEEEQSGLFLAADYEIGQKVDGRKPDTSVLKLKGCKIELEGQFNRGDRLILLNTVQITGDHDDDSIETQTGVVKATAKAQLGTVCGTARLGEFVRTKLADESPAYVDEVLSKLDLTIED